MFATSLFLRFVFLNSVMKSKMNLFQRVFFSILIAFFLESIRFGNAGNDYLPVYFKISIAGEFHFIYNVSYDPAEKRYVVKAPNYRILVACPALYEHSDNLEVRDIVLNKAEVLPICDRPNKSRILKVPSEDNQEDVRIIGFTVNSGTVKIIDLIVFKYDTSFNRIKFAWYNIAPGKLLSPEKYGIFETNEDIYGYNIDNLYSEASASGGPYVKVPLAPEEDFYFEYVKSASRRNILTAPMRRELLPHWQNLEKFTRRVTQIIDSVSVMAGIHGTLTQPDDESKQQTIYLHDGKQAIPSLFWKVIFIEFEHNEKFYRNGIIFVLHNVDPNTKEDIKRICPNDENAVSNTGWELPVDDKLKRLMYACLWNPVNMEAFGEEECIENQVFNLNEVPTIRTNKEGEEIFEIVNVIERINRNSGINWLLSYFVDAFSYPFSCFSNKIKNK